MNSYRVSTVNVPESPLTGHTGGPWQQRCDSLHFTKNDGVLYHQLPSFSPLSLCDYDLFAKVKEPLRGPRYNTRDELIRAIGRLLRKINKYGHADGVRCLPKIWQKAINKGATILKVYERCTLVNKVISEISSCWHFLFIQTSYYDIFAKVKEPLRGIRYNTGDELIRAIGRSIENVNKDGHADGVRRVPNISQNVINEAGDCIEGT